MSSSTTLAPKTNNTSDQQVTTETPSTGGNVTAYPEQRHAGQVGYGPNYHTGPTLEEKVTGLREELMGKVTGSPDRVQHGHDILNGEEKRKKLTGEDKPSPFDNVDKEDNESKLPSGASGPSVGE